MRSTKVPHASDRAWPETFEVFYENQWLRTARLAYLVTGSAAAAEDLAQEAFLRLRPHYATARNPQAYLRSTTVNLCRTWHRRSARGQHGPQDLESVETGPAETASDLIDKLKRLSYRQRAVVVMRYWGGWSEEEIAAALGCRPGTVKSLAARALSNLRKEFNDDERSD